MILGRTVPLANISLIDMKFPDYISEELRNTQYKDFEARQT